MTDDSSSAKLVEDGAAQTARFFQMSDSAGKGSLIAGRSANLKNLTPPASLNRQVSAFLVYHPRRFPNSLGNKREDIVIDF